MYGQMSRSHALLRKSDAFDTAEDTSASPAVYGGLLVCAPIKVSGLYFYVTVAIDAATTPPQVEVNRRPTYDSASGEILMASLTLPHGTAAGKVVYKKIEPVLCYPGDEISFEHTVQADDAGSGFYGIDFEVVAEAPGNASDLVASA